MEDKQTDYRNIFTSTSLSTLKSKYREVLDFFGLFFDEVNITYGKAITKQLKIEVLKQYIALDRIEDIDEASIARKVILQSHSVKRSLESMASRIIGYTA